MDKHCFYIKSYAFILANECSHSSSRYDKPNIDNSKKEDAKEVEA